MKPSDPESSVYVISPSGAVFDPVRAQRASNHLQSLGFSVQWDRDAMRQVQRFAGSDAQRIAAFARATRQPASIVMASRGGYGLTRLLPFLDYAALAKANKKWLGFSDFTAFHLAMLAQAKAVTWSGVSLLDSFGAEQAQDNDENTIDCFIDAMIGSLEILGFRYSGPKEVDVRGTLWGGNLAITCSLLGTPYFPQVNGGILFVEDVNEHPYRIERHLTQLLHAGVIDKQKAVLFGYFNGYRLFDNDKGYDMPAVLKWLRSRTKTPILTGLPFGHTISDPAQRYQTRLTIPHGARIGLATEGRTCYLVLPHQH